MTDNTEDKLDCLPVVTRTQQECLPGPTPRLHKISDYLRQVKITLLMPNPQLLSELVLKSLLEFEKLNGMPFPEATVAHGENVSRETMDGPSFSKRSVVGHADGK